MTTSGRSRHGGTVAGRRPAATAPGPSWRRVFAGRPAEVAALRRWLAGCLPDCGSRDDVVSVAVELATNAIRHTSSGRGGVFSVEIAWQSGRASLRVAITDGGARRSPQLPPRPGAAAQPDPAGSPGPADPAGLLAEHGRGLAVVAALASRTGVLGTGRGRLVWAEIPWTGAPLDQDNCRDRRPESAKGQVAAGDVGWVG